MDDKEDDQDLSEFYSNPNYDLSRPEAWLGARPGAPRREVFASLTAAGLTLNDEADEDGCWHARRDLLHLELYFEKDGDERLRQVSLDDERYHWGGKPIICEDLGALRAALGDAARDAAWRLEDDVSSPFEELGPPKSGPVSDDQLMMESTLWCPSRAMCFSIYYGVILDVAWRALGEVPRQFTGPLTEAQVQLSCRPDIDEYLDALKEKANPVPVPVVVPKHPLQRPLLILAWVIYAVVAYDAFQETKRWRQAQTITGKLAALETKPGTQAVQLYRVEYLDPAGQPQTATLEGADFYTAPAAIGDEAQIACVPGPPPEVKGLPRARDVGFLAFLPRLIAVSVIHTILNFILGALAKRKATPQPPAPGAPPDGVTVI